MQLRRRRAAGAEARRRQRTAVHGGEGTDASPPNATLQGCTAAREPTGGMPATGISNKQRAAQPWRESDSDSVTRIR